MNRSARIGAPIALGVIGAILYFAVADVVEAVDLSMIGLIAMVAAGLWLILELILNRPRDRVSSERTTVQDPAAGQTAYREERVRRDEI